VKVLFVCMGNICRSPTAEAVFRKMVAESPLAGKIDIDSAGTHGYHTGAPPDERATAHAAKRGYDLSPLRARQVSAADVEHFDYVLAMDDINLRQLKAMCPSRLQHRIELLLDYGGEEDENIVPDPYQGDDRYRRTTARAWGHEYARRAGLGQHGCRRPHLRRVYEDLCRDAGDCESTRHHAGVCRDDQ
jgi:protein-tyrosine phosphatase